MVRVQLDRPLISRRLMDRLLEIDDENLHIKRWRNWLLIHHRRSLGVAPEQYPTLLDEGVQLGRLIIEAR